MNARLIPYTLNFKAPSGTSRGVMTERKVWYLILESEGQTGIGECSPLPGLSLENPQALEARLQECLQEFHQEKLPDLNRLAEFPSLRFAIESALHDLKKGGKRILFPSAFTEGRDTIPINGLIWMGSLESMKDQVRNKVEQGFRVIKMKIGAMDFAEELKLLLWIRVEYSNHELELRVDANGAFNASEAMDKLNALAEFKLHSIEQPIAQGQTDALKALCTKTPVPVALDEELIPITQMAEKRALLEKVRPHYIILKPSLHGGFMGCEEWISIAEKLNIGWWITSALESNVGLNAIAQWTYHISKPDLTHGLGTGKLFTNNIDSPLHIREGALGFDVSSSWDLESILHQA